jgi:uncharacterized membrane protein
VDKTRLEAFSDGVIAIIITIMVLEMKVPHETNIDSLLKLGPVFLSYTLSFVFVGIYWNNHHHLLQAAHCVTGKVLWANLHLLFWLSLIPFTTGWMGENNFPPLPVALYGVVLFFAAIAYFILSKTLVNYHGQDSNLARALRSDIKEKSSLAIYAAAIPLAFFQTYIAYGLYVLVALWWLVPDRRIERVLEDVECDPKSQ